MIKLVRVDHRLLHGQVAFSWIKYLEADCVLVVSDEIVHDSLKFSALKMAKPSGIKLVIKSVKDSIEALQSGATDKYKLFIVTESVKDVYTLAKNVPAIRSINLGGMKNAPDRKQISKAVHLSEQDIQWIEGLVKDGIDINIQLVPNDKKENINNFI